MSGPSKVIVLDPDPRAGRQVQLGFEREGIQTLAPALPADPKALELPADTGLVLVGGSNGNGLDLVRRARELLTAANADVPIIVTGRAIQRGELEAAGADEVVVGPVFLRDVVILGRILRGTPAEQRTRIVGSLAETTGVYNLVRALCALGRSAVLTLIRGLRRGEVRFYRGEVTSAQVGLIHGQAALHQLLLWTDARFDFSHEDVVRRQQIPLSPEELFADAERFLEGVRESAGALSPASVLEPDVARVQDLGKQIPTEVHGVLRMFDGHRVLADILEDSPYRVFETLRVALKAVEAGLLKPVDAQRPKATWKAVLAIDEWLVGSETREAVVERTSAIDSSPVSSPKRKGKGAAKRRSKKAEEPSPERQTGIDWGALVPRMIGAEVGPLAPVVPSFAAHGEIGLKSRDVQREKLEAMMDTGKRDRIFPTDIGLEPKIIIDGGDDRESDEWNKAVVDAKGKADATDDGQRDRKKRDDDTAPIPHTEPAKRGGRRTPAAGIATAATPATGIPATADTPVAGVPITGAAKRSRRTPAAGVPVTGAAKEPSKRSRRTPAAGVRKITEPPTGLAIPAIPAVDPPVQTDSDTDQDEAREWADVERRAKERAEADDNPATAATADTQATADAEARAAQATADAETEQQAAKAKADADERAAHAKADADERKAVDAKTKADADERAAADATATTERAAADATATTDADERAPADATATTERAVVDATATTDRETADVTARTERAAADAKSKAAAETVSALTAQIAAAVAPHEAKAATTAELPRDTPFPLTVPALPQRDTPSPLDAANASADVAPQRDTPSPTVAANASAGGASSAPAVAPQRNTPITLAAVAARAKAELDAKAEAKRGEAQARAKSATEALRAIVEAETRAVAIRADAEAKAKLAAEAKAKADREASERATADAAAAAEKAAAETAAAAAKARLAEIAERKNLERRAREEVASKIDEDTSQISAAEGAKAYAARVKAAAQAKRAGADAQTTPASDTDQIARVEPEPPKRPSLDAEALVKQLVSEAIPPTVGPRRTPPMGMPAPSMTPADAPAATSPTIAAVPSEIPDPASPAIASPGSAGARSEANVEPRSMSGAITAPVARIDETEAAETTPFLRPDIDSVFEHSGAKITVSEAPSTTVLVSDVVTVASVAAADTATITASPRVMITDSPVIQAGHATPQLLVTAPDPAPSPKAAVAVQAAPIHAEDEPSDGIIRSSTGESESDRLARLRRVRPPNPPEHDGPEIKETTGEIRQSTPRESKVPDTSEPSILIADQPATLVSDLATIHAAAAAAGAHKATAPITDAASSSKELEVSGVRKDAVAFTSDEEAFFKSAESHTHSVPRVESFDDLDEGYLPPPSFWSRVFGKKPKK